ncbi:Interleukin-5 receptor subunit alpha [Galemys pyrenaicus]|uniref:Interleukin-5 receptor subunit alpha n=1 Tax=Galemys pyrenaicus TaxID=202257 RepID=A0A8J6DSM6_GALPY|nr:Interleukin-5 receptor subunit alpha [Galemys pyrenaicus]
MAGECRRAEMAPRSVGAGWWGALLGPHFLNTVWALCSSGRCPQERGTCRPRRQLEREAAASLRGACRGGLHSVVSVEPASGILASVPDGEGQVALMILQTRVSLLPPVNFSVAAAGLAQVLLRWDRSPTQPQGAAALGFQVRVHVPEEADYETTGTESRRTFALHQGFSASVRTVPWAGSPGLLPSPWVSAALDPPPGKAGPERPASLAPGLDSARSLLLVAVLRPAVSCPGARTSAAPAQPLHSHELQATHSPHSTSHKVELTLRSSDVCPGPHTELRVPRHRPCPADAAAAWALAWAPEWAHPGSRPTLMGHRRLRPHGPAQDASRLWLALRTAVSTFSEREHGPAPASPRQASQRCWSARGPQRRAPASAHAPAPELPTAPRLQGPDGAGGGQERGRRGPAARGQRVAAESRTPVVTHTRACTRGAAGSWRGRLGACAARGPTWRVCARTLKTGVCGGRRGAARRPDLSPADQGAAPDGAGPRQRAPQGLTRGVHQRRSPGSARGFPGSHPAPGHLRPAAQASSFPHTRPGSPGTSVLNLTCSTHTWASEDAPRQYLVSLRCSWLLGEAVPEDGQYFLYYRYGARTEACQEYGADALGRHVSCRLRRTSIRSKGLEPLAVRVNGSSARAAIRPLERLFALPAIDQVNPPGNVSATEEGRRLSVRWEKPVSAFPAHCFDYEVQIRNERTGCLQTESMKNSSLVWTMDGASWYSIRARAAVSGRCRPQGSWGAWSRPVHAGEYLGRRGAGGRTAWRPPGVAAPKPCWPPPELPTRTGPASRGAGGCGGPARQAVLPGHLA